jgi:protein-S-isoprenylcysteine O-methyltransferase Ste14
MELGEHLINELVRAATDLYLSIPIQSRIAYIGWVFYIAAYAYVLQYERVNNLLKERRIIKRNSPYTLYTCLLISVVVTYCFELLGWNASPLPPDGAVNYFYVELVGFILMCVGIYVSLLARACLNGMWGGAIFEYPNNDARLVTDGIYAMVRHPIYFGQIVTFGGTVLMTNNHYLWILWITILVANIVRAIREDRDLLNRYGSEMEEYRDKTAFLIPFS